MVSLSPGFPSFSIKPMKAMIDDLDGLLGCPSGLNNAVSHRGPILGRDKMVSESGFKVS